MSRRTNSAGRGHAVVEVALMAPWIFLLFMGVFDFGFYAYGMVSVTNAARVAALYTSADAGTVNQPGTACLYVLEELRMLPNVGSSLSCSCSGTSCTAGPITVQTLGITGPDGESAAQVSVTYSSPQLFPIPGLTGLMRITRIAKMKV